MPLLLSSYLLDITLAARRRGIDALPEEHFGISGNQPRQARVLPLHATGLRHRLKKPNNQVQAISEGGKCPSSVGRTSRVCFTLPAP